MIIVRPNNPDPDMMPTALKMSQGRPRPELIALATWEVFGRFSVQ